MTFLRPSNFNRYRKIAEVMARHGFGAVAAEMGLGSALNIPRRLLRREPPPETRRTAAQHLREALEELGPTFVKLGSCKTMFLRRPGKRSK
jgi:ubiquinone biosynthesis protein